MYEIWRSESIDTILVTDSPWERAGATLCLHNNQRVSSASRKVYCLYGLAGGRPKACCIIYTVNKLSSFAPLSMDNYDSF